MTRFDACLAFTLAREGLFNDDPRDSGRATMKGVTLATYRDWTDNPAATADELRAITDPQLRALYSVRYWQPCRCQDLPAGVDLMVFDHGVNCGVRRSAILVQNAVGVTADGWIGPATLAGVHKIPVASLIDMLARMQDHYYRRLVSFPTYGRGWLSRLQQRKATAYSAASAAKASPFGGSPALPPTILA